MATEEFIIALFCRVDAMMDGVCKHPQAKLYPSEVVTLALLYALKGCGARAFYRWLSRDYRQLFPALPERTRLFRLFVTHRDWADRFLAAPTVLGIADSYGIEWRHPRRHGRTTTQLGKKGLSNQRWIAGGKLCVVLNQWGRIVAWDDATANVHDSTFQPLIARFAEQMSVLTDGTFHRQTGDPVNMRVCRRGTWPQRLLVETVCSLLTRVCQRKKLSHRGWACFHAHLAFVVAVFTLLVDWHGLQTDEQGVAHLSLAAFSL